MNQAVGQVGQNMQKSATNPYLGRLFGVRTRVERNDGSSNGGVDTPGSQIRANYREFRKTHRIELDGSSVSTLSFSPSSEAPSYRSPVLSVEQQAGSSFDPGIIASGSNWEVFAAANFGEQRLDAINSMPGMISDLQTSAIGFEYVVSDRFSVGGGWSHVWSDNQVGGGLGSADFEGDAVIGYVTYFENNFWADLLYSYGSYESDVRRNTPFGTTVTGAPDQTAHLTSLNIGYNIPAMKTLVHGPTFSVDYSQGDLDAYTESGDPRANTTYAAQEFESLITRLGWQVNWSSETNWGTMIPQARLSYARENLNQDNLVAGVLANSPVGVGAVSQNRVAPGEGWMELGFGISIHPKDNFSLIVDYTTQLFRDDLDAHFGSISASMRF